MQRIHVTALASLTLAVVAAGCSPSEAPEAAAADVVDAGPNAAEEYRLLFGMFDRNDRRFNPHEPPSSEAINWLVQNQDTIDRIIQTSRIERCDWKTDYSSGASVLLPHLGSMRHLSGVLVLEAHRRADAGDHAGAAEAIAAQIRMARHVSDEPVMVASLTAIAILDRALRQAQTLIARPNVTREAKQIVAAALDALDPADPVQGRRTLAMERVVLREIIMIGGPHRLPGSGRATEVTPDEWSRQVEALTEAQRRELADEVDVLLHQFEQAWFSPQLEGQFLAIEEQASPLAREPASHIWVFRSQIERVRGRIADLRPALEQ